MRPQFDERDEEIKLARVKLFEARPGPRVGDFVLMLDGTTRRFTFNHGPEWGIQTSAVLDGKVCMGSYYFNAGGCLDYSGGLDSAIPHDTLIDTGQTRPAWCWFFHHDWAGADCGVDTQITVRVYRQIAV